MSTLEAISTLLGVACVGLGVVRSWWTFPTAIASVALLGIVVARERLYSDALLQLFFIAANLYGWREWRRSRSAAGEVVVERMANGERLRWLAGAVVAAAVWGAAMRLFTDASYPWWDAGVASASIAAQLLMARRKWENWAIWIAVDLASVPLYSAKHLWAFAGLYVIYLALAVCGLLDWTRAGRVARAAAA